MMREWDWRGGIEMKTNRGDEKVKVMRVIRSDGEDKRSDSWISQRGKHIRGRKKGRNEPEKRGKRNNGRMEEEEEVQRKKG